MTHLPPRSCDDEAESLAIGDAERKLDCIERRYCKDKAEAGGRLHQSGME